MNHLIIDIHTEIGKIIYEFICSKCGKSADQEFYLPLPVTADRVPLPFMPDGWRWHGTSFVSELLCPKHLLLVKDNPITDGEELVHA